MAKIKTQYEDSLTFSYESAVISDGFMLRFLRFYDILDFSPDFVLFSRLRLRFLDFMFRRFAASFGFRLASPPPFLLWGYSRSIFPKSAHQKNEQTVRVQTH